MKQIPRRRWFTLVLTPLLAIGVAVSATSCDVVSRSWAWKLGKTHGAIVETTAGRASLGVYRVPTRALYGVMKAKGVSEVQKYLWKFGQPPELKKTFTYRGRSLTLEFGTGTAALRKLTYKLIYDDPGDLRAALVDTHRADSCLALTLISYGKPTSNWTNKQTDCRDGAIA
jgi:hypothetical protein